MRSAAVLALVCLPAAAAAQMLPGADDPAYASALTAALADNDRAALADLHRLAEAGSPAATVALAAVSGWYAVGTTLAERRVFRAVNGVVVVEAAAVVHPPFGLWSTRTQGLGDDILTRAEALFAAGEPLKGARVADLWLNQTGAGGEVPPAFWADLPVMPWTRALALISRLSYQPAAPAADLAILLGWIEADRPEGWLALTLLEARPEITADGAMAGLVRRAIDAAVAARDPDEVAARRAAAAALRAMALQGQSPDAVDAAAMDGVAAMLAQAGADLPLRLWCDAACPAAPASCTTAAVAAFGVAPMLVDDAAPMAAALPLADWFASPRGGHTVLMAGFMAHRAAPGDPEAIETALRGPAMTRAVGMDVCFAASVQAALPDLVTRRFSR
ncbi:MAG: hypothetical protein MUF73_20010 [Rhodobacteraceae bacterium]|jgi:hypothetical protein|nr:hypothetical protein [Paracoccaceae bacterium]